VYLSQLAHKLRALPAKEIADALEYYESYFNEAEDETAAMAALGPPSEVAAAVMSEYVSRVAVLDEAGAAGRPRIKTAYIAILAVLALPIGLPLAAGAFGLLVGLLALVFSVVVTGIALIIGGVFSLVTFPLAVVHDFWLGILSAGMGLAALGLGILVFMGSKRLIGGVPVIMRGILRRERIRRVVPKPADNFSDQYANELSAHDAPKPGKRRIHSLRLAVLLIVLGGTMFGAAWLAGARGGVIYWQNGRFNAEIHRRGGVAPSEIDLRTENFTEIYVRTSSASVTVLPTRENPRVEYTGIFDVSTSGGVLSVIDNTSASRPFSLLNFGFTPGRRVRVYLPYDMYQQISLNVRTSSGRIFIEGGVFDDVTATSSSGRIQIKNVDALGNLTVNSSSGRISAENVSVQGDILAQTSSGGIRMENAAWDNLTASSSSGRINITDGRASAGSDIRVTSSSGGVSLEIMNRRDDFVISMRSNSGSLRLDGERIRDRSLAGMGVGTGDGTIYIRTSSGRATLDFSG